MALRSLVQAQSVLVLIIAFTGDWWVAFVNFGGL
jgi:hypothetical protein